MASTIAAPPRIVLPPEGGGAPDSAPHSANRTGLILTLAAISMMFIGLTSAYVVGEGLNPVWQQIHMRPLIWIDTAILLASSYTMERARRHLSARWLIATLLLGIAFLAGQIGVFAQLAQDGLYLNTGRQASFYYVLTSLHGLHILGGIFALGWVALRLRRSTLDLTAIYWHFMDALWLYLLAVIFV
ncbi:MAG TPA: cytochrome c oxidase subunit 3 [Bryobacteraceae bacterium]|nr:cytochrome c oxidase subunit 3 [Bryobacteraceae bacterium]